MKRFQVSEMVVLQNNMNSVIDSEWVTKDWDFLRATMIEATEAIEHHGWKWWKAQKKDLPQLQMEIIDIWHFILSHYIKNNKGDLEKTIDQVISEYNCDVTIITFDSKTYTLERMELVEKLELLIGLSVSKRVEMSLFKSIAKGTEITDDMLFEQYVQKNILNIFRQNNGYKEGHYIKIWFGREDNEHLVDVSKKYSSSDQNYSSNIYNSLQTIYEKL